MGCHHRLYQDRTGFDGLGLSIQEYIIMWTKVFIILVMLTILASLGSGLFFLVKDQGKSKRTIKALSWRIGLSLSLFLFLFAAFALGIIQPHSLG